MLPPAVPLSASEIQASPSAKEEPAAVPKKESRESIQRKQAAKQPSEARRVYWVSELPEAVRRELPTLVMNGGSYSSNPAQRLIIVNNQVFTEGSQPVPGVVVQRIEPSAAVLSFQGYWYRLGY
jgi:general secretion pathway protein B